jgi:hypothetical protein
MKKNSDMGKHGWRALLAAVGLSACVPGDDGPPLDPQLMGQTSGTRALLQAVSVVDALTVWVRDRPPALELSCKP